MALTKKNEASTGYKAVDLFGGPIREHEMTFSDEVKQLLIQQLTDIYNDPREATVRETVSNALDATVAARKLGQETSPVEIIAPSAFEQTFQVIDHGVGMTAEQLDLYFSDYGNSSKILDMDAIGSKGLGAKAPLAYTTTCTIDTVHDGRRVVITMNRGEQANVTKTILDEPTDLPNGTTVKVPVASDDIQAFNNAIDRYKRYASPDLPIVIDGKKYSIEDHYRLLGKYVIAYDNDGKPVKTNLWARLDDNRHDITRVCMEWARYVDNVHHDNDNYSWIVNNVEAVLSGWNYRLDGRGWSTPGFVIELVPGVLDFPASRDEVKKNDRLNEFVGILSDSLQLKDERSKAELMWGNVTDHADRIAILDCARSYHYHTQWSDLMDKWPEEAAVYTADPSKPKAKYSVAFEYKTNRNGSVSISDIRVAFPEYWQASSKDEPTGRWSWNMFSKGSKSQGEFLSGTIDSDVIDSHCLNFKTQRPFDMLRKRKDDDAAASAELLGTPLDWLAVRPTVDPTIMMDGNCAVVIVSGKIPAKLKDNASSLLRRWGRYLKKVKKDAGDSRYFTVMFHVIDGTITDEQADAIKTACEKAHIPYVGVKTWEDLETEAKNAAHNHTGSSTSSNKSTATVHEGHISGFKISANHDRWLAIYDAINAVDNRADRLEIDLAKAVNDGARVLIYKLGSDDYRNSKSYLKWTIIRWIVSLGADYQDHELILINELYSSLYASMFSGILDKNAKSVYLDSSTTARLRNLKALSRATRVYLDNFSIMSVGNMLFDQMANGFQTNGDSYAAKRLVAKLFDSNKNAARLLEVVSTSFTSVGKAQNDYESRIDEIIDWLDFRDYPSSEMIDKYASSADKRATNDFKKIVADLSAISTVENKLAHSRYDCTDPTTYTIARLVSSYDWPDLAASLKAGNEGSEGLRNMIESWWDKIAAVAVK